MNSDLWTTNKDFLAYLAATLLGCCALAASTVYAGDETRETVTYQDLDVSTPEGAAALYARIHAAAVRVCNQSDAVLKLGEPYCIVKAEAKAVERANVPALTAYYRTKTGRQPAALAVSR